jgi:PAS domain S-box-containing protein
MTSPEIRNTVESYELETLRRIETELKVRLRQQAAVARLGQLALSTVDLGALMEETANLITGILQVNYCKVLEAIWESGDLRLVAGVGWREGVIGKLVMSGGIDSQAGYTLMSDRPVIVEDIANEIRFSSSKLFRDHGIVSGMSVIIPGPNRPYGVLGVHTDEKRHFTYDDAYFLQSVANVLASAIVRFKSDNVLRTSRDQLAIILKGVTDGVIVQEAGGRIVYANSAAAEILGFPSDQALLNTTVPDLYQLFDVRDENGTCVDSDLLPGSRTLQGEGPTQAVLRFQTKESGNERWSSVRCTPVYNQAGQVELIVHIFQDVTELKLTEISRKLLAEAGDVLTSTLDYQSILRGVAQLAVAHLSDWCVVYLLNDEGGVNTVTLTNVDPEKVELAYELQERFPPKLNPNFGLGKVLSTGKPEFFPLVDEDLLIRSGQSDEYLQLIRQFGLRSAIILPLLVWGKAIGAISLIWAESGRGFSQYDAVMAEELARLSGLALENSRLYHEAQELNANLESRVNKRTAQLQTIISKLRTEVNERKKAEDALRQSEALLNSLFESAPDATFLVDGEACIIRVNSQAEAMFGYNREELAGMYLDDLLLPRLTGWKMRSRIKTIFTMKRQKIAAGTEIVGRQKDGRQFPLDVLFNAVDTPEGRRVICALRDITERKQMEAELAEVQRRLIESAEAERKHIAHELHDGPIQDLYSVTFNLKELINSEAGLKQELNQSHELVNQVITQLREMCSDLRPPSLAPYGLEKAIRAHIERLKENQPDLEVIIALKPDEQLLPERTRLALFRIYQHAVSNVIRHAQASRLEIKLDHDQHQLALEIADNGKGFQLPKKWVELARKGRLGLVGTVERAQAIGGQVEINSQPGRGTVLKVKLPLPRQSGSENTSVG